MALPARYRPFRLVLWAAYYVVALTFVGSIIYSGVTGVMRQADLHPAPGSNTDPGRCATDLSKLYDSLWLEARKGQPEFGPLRTQLEAIGTRCSLDAAAGQAPLSRAYAVVIALENDLERARGQWAAQVSAADAEARAALTAIGAAPSYSASP